MKFTSSLKKNYEFKRLYAKGRSAADRNLVVYCRKNGGGKNRVGITVGGKIGNAVIRNRVRRRLREAYRLNEDKLSCGYDIVIVARTRAIFADFVSLCDSMLQLLKKTGV